MIVERLTLGPLETNCYLVSEGAGGPVVVVDPADEPDAIIRAVGDRAIAAVVLTHGHFDHLGAVEQLLRARPAPLMVHEADAERITSEAGTGGAMFGFAHKAPPAERVLADGDVVHAGGLDLHVLHTPGHTPGSICLLAEAHLLTGDTLFAGSVGRTDFPGGDIGALRRSIARLAGLPDATRIHPGHGPESTIARERRVNPFFPRA